MIMEIILSTLAAAVSILSIVTFFNGRKKDDRASGKESGELRADLKYIKDVLLDVRGETKEINKLLENHSVEIARARESISSAHKRIDEALVRIENLEKRDGN